MRSKATATQGVMICNETVGDLVATGECQHLSCRAPSVAVKLQEGEYG